MITDYTPQIEYIAYAKDSKKSFKQVNAEQSTYDIKFMNKKGKVISMKNFGVTQSGETVSLFTITNKKGMSIDLTDFGATIVSIKVPDKNGNLIDVAQGYDSVKGYDHTPVGHAGGTIGPVACKIDWGKFILNGKEYKIETNKDNGRTHCHGASNGFDIKVWNYELIKDGIKFIYKKTDGEGGFPANVVTTVTYLLKDDNSLHILYNAVSDADSVLSLTNHSYFNLDGEENSEFGKVLEHVAQVKNSSKILETNEISIPTGEYLEIKNTPFDFTKPMKFKEHINDDNEILKNTKGYDQTFVVDNYDGKKVIDVARVKSENTGITLTVSTNYPVFQFYTANNLGKSTQPNGKSGKRYEKYSSFCVEPQFAPNAINTENFEKPILKTGEVYSREIVYKFGVEK